MTAPRRSEPIVGLLLALAVLPFLPACGGDEDEGGGAARPAAAAGPLSWEEAVVLNNRGVALMDMGMIGAATEVFRQIAERAPDCIEGRVNLAIALLNTTKTEPADREADYAECERLLLEVRAQDPKNPWAAYTLGVLLGYLGRDQNAVLAAYEAAYDLDPDDPDVCYRLGKALMDVRPDPNLEAAVTMLERSLRLEPHFQSAMFTLNQALRRLRRAAEAKDVHEVFMEFENLQPAVGRKLELVYNAMGRYANAMRRVAPFGGATPPRPEAAAIRFEAPRVLAAPLVAVAPDALSVKAGDSLREVVLDRLPPLLSGGIAVHDLDGDGSFEVYVSDGRGVGRLFRLREGGAEDVTEAVGLAAPGLRSIGGVFGDVDHDGAPDLYVYGAGDNALFLNDGRGGLRRVAGLEAGGHLTLHAQIADLDQDGDLDVAVANYAAIPGENEVVATGWSFPESLSGAPNVVYGNDRPTIYDDEGREGFSVRAQEILGTRSDRSAALLAADLDADGDPDLLEVVDGGANRLLMNDRHWRFRDEAPARGADDAGPGRGALAFDADMDGVLEIAVSRGPGAVDALLISAENGRYRSEAFATRPGDAAAPEEGALLAADLDNDGDLDLVSARPDAADGEPRLIVRARTRDLRPGEIAWNDAGACPPGIRGMVALDLNGDGLLDLLGATRGGGLVALVNATKTDNRWIRLSLRGKRVLDTASMWTNHFGVGARVEVAAGELHVFADVLAANGLLAGPLPTLHLGLGRHERADSVRVLWPDLVIQSERDLAAGEDHEYVEVNRKASSCPVIFVDRRGDGRFEFLTDFLGVGGLGFWIGPDRYAPPDATEMVRLGALEPGPDHRIEIRISEPMEEIAYLDRLGLVAVDHPEGVTVHADERLAISGPPPSGRPIAHERSFAPTAAATRSGEDTLGELLEVDRRYQKGVLRDRRFLGYLVEDQELTLRFDADEIMASRPRADARLRMLIDGWVEYPYSHVNFAGHQAALQSRSLSLDVRSGGAWKPLLEDVGYPAGMARTMALDVTAAVDHGLEALRLRTNLEVWIDRIRLAWDADPGRVVTHAIDPDVADLRFLGYPLEHSPDGRMPTVYDYDRIAPTFDWKSMAGRYTRYGDVRPLLLAADDRMVIMNHGDEIALSLDVRRLPPLPPGWTRTWFLEAVGWCKDMDAYTATPGTVLPLPYGGMGDYPPPPGSGPFDRPELRAWDREWNTREIEGTFPR